MRLISIERNANKALDLPVHLARAYLPVAMSDLSERERTTLSTFGTAARRHEWLVGRSALKKALRAQQRDEDTAKLRLPEPGISLTHDNGRAIAVAALARCPGLGIDYERVRPVNPRVAGWFLDADEQRLLPDPEKDSFPAELFRLWTIKEAAFKCHARNDGMTLGDFRVVDAVDEQHTELEAVDGLCIRVFSARHHHGYLSLAGVVK